MHAEVCSVLVTASCVWNVDKYLVALQRLRVVDLIGQDVVGCDGFKQLGGRVRQSRQLWQVH